MKNRLLAFGFIFVLLLSSLFAGATNASAASRWSDSTSDTLSYFYVGAGWGSVSFTSYLNEQYSYTYRTELYWHEVSHGYKTSTPYSSSTKFSNKYYDLSGTYLGGMSSLSNAGALKYSYIHAGGSSVLSATSTTDMYANAGNRARVKHTVGLYVYKDGGTANVVNKTYTMKNI